MKRVVILSSLLLTITAGVAAPKVITKPNFTVKPRGIIHSVAWSPDSKKLVIDSKKLPISTRTSAILILDADQGRELLKLDGDPSLAKKAPWRPDGKLLAWSSDGRHIASGVEGKIVKVWSATNGKVIHTIKCHDVAAVAWGPAGKKLAIGEGNLGSPGFVKIWDMATGKIHHTFKGFTGKPSSLAWNPSGKTLAVVGLEGSEYTTSIWDINSGKKQKSFKEASSIQSVAWSLNGKRLASGGDTMTVRNPVTGKTLYTYPSRDISWNPTISKWADGSKVVDSEAGQTIINFTTLGGQMGAVWSPDGKRLASFNHTKLQVWDLPEVSIPIYFKKLYTLKTGVEEERGFSKAAVLEEREDERQTYMEWGPKGKQLVNRLSDGTIVIWNTDTGKKHVVIKGFRIGYSRHYHGEIFWSPSGNRIAAFEVDYFKANILKVWDTTTGENIHSVKSKKGGYIHAPFGWSPNGKKLACLTQSRDNFLLI